MDSQDIWLPYIITHAFSFALIFICWKWPKIGKVVWGIIFILAGIFNMYLGNSSPQKYVEYGQHAVRLYQKFIYSSFSSYTSLFVSLIALGQILVGILLLMKKTFFLLGILGGIIFLAAISPLGIGSAFPATLFMVFSLVLLYIWHRKT